MGKKSGREPAVRTSSGARDVLFDEIDALRNGDSTPDRANAMARLVSGVIQTVKMELQYHHHVRSLPQGAEAPLISPLKLSDR